MTPEQEIVSHQAHDRDCFDDLNDVMVLDSASSIDLFGNKKFLSAIGQSDDPVLVGTNARQKHIEKDGEVLGYPARVYHDPAGSLDQHF